MDYDKYDAYERKKYIKELTQLWLHTRSFRELGMILPQKISPLQ